MSLYYSTMGIVIREVTAMPRKRPGPPIQSQGWLVICRPRKGSLTLRLRYSTPEGRKEVWLGYLYISNTPVLDTILSSTGKLSVDELMRIRDCDKSWSRIHP